MKVDLQGALNTIRNYFKNDFRFVTLDAAAKEWAELQFSRPGCEQAAHAYAEAVRERGITPADLGELEAQTRFELDLLVVIRGLAALLRRNDLKLAAEELRRIGS